MKSRIHKSFKKHIAASVRVDGRMLSCEAKHSSGDVLSKKSNVKIEREIASSNI